MEKQPIKTIANSIFDNHIAVESDGSWYVKDIDLFRHVISEHSVAKGPVEFEGPVVVVFKDGSSIEFEVMP